MNQAAQKADPRLACLGCLLVLATSSIALAQQAQPPAPDPVVDEKPERVLDLTSPRATMREFLVAIQDADADHPERIDDAVECLDTSQLEVEHRAERARGLARRLHAVIDKAGVTLKDIPEGTIARDYSFRRFEAEEGEAGPAGIALQRDPIDGRWRFTASTLASIPALEKAVEQSEPTPPAVETDVPAARRSARATVATFLEAMNADPPDLREAVQCLDKSGQDPQAWGVRGRDLAVKLKNVMDKIELVVLSEIPDEPEGDPYVWHTSKTGNITIARIAEGDSKGEWRFRPQTLKTLDALYLELEDQPIISELREAGIDEKLTFGLRLQRMMPDWLRTESSGLQGWQWVALVALLPLGWLVKVIVGAAVMFLVRTWVLHRKIDIDQDVRRRAFQSSGALGTVLFWWLTIDFNYLQLPPELVAVLLPMTKLALAVTTVWVGYRCVDILGGYIAANEAVRLTRFDDVLIPLLQKILRLFVVIIVVIFVLEWWGKEWTTLLGALGIGGLAVAFAAKDTLGNFFGSITVLLDRPFGIGDWIVIGDVEGTVERVGFRSTRVRTFYNSVVTIPNSAVVNTQVDNYGARRYRRAKIMLSVTYDTPPERMDAFCEGIRELIRLHPSTRKDYYHVYFNKFAASSLDILLYTFFEVPDWATELRERHRLFLDILRLAHRLGIQFAFPTQTVWLERRRDGVAPAEAVSIAPGLVDPETVGLDEAARIFEDAYGPEPPHRPPVVIDTIPRSKRRQT